MVEARLTSAVCPTAAQDTCHFLREIAGEIIGTTRLFCVCAIQTPDLEAKILFGRHVHDDSVLVRNLINRLRELQEPFEVEAAARQLSVETLLRDVAGFNAPQKFHHLYYAIKQPLAIRCDSFAAGLVRVLDEPTKRLLHFVSSTLRKQIDEAEVAFNSMQNASETYRALPALKLMKCESRPDTLAEKFYPTRDSRFNAEAPQGKFSEAEATRSMLDYCLPLLHFNLTDVEIPTIEACCRCILEFPEMPWDFVCDMARQSWDESRHAQAFWDRLNTLGGNLGSYRHSFALWEMATNQELAVRLCLHQRIGEWLGVLVANWYSREYARLGDLSTAELFDFVDRDEVTHVEFGNRWIRWLCTTETEIERISELAYARRRLVLGRHSYESGPLRAPFDPIVANRAGFTEREVSEFSDRFEKFGSLMRPH